MLRTDVVVIGAGQAGLAASRELSARGIAHVLLERGRVAERWRTATWDSLRLLTPNWMTRLPDWQYRGSDPDGFMARDEVIRFFSSYAGAVAAPIISESPVLRLSGSPGDFSVETPSASWRSRAVVIATGQCEHPAIPDSSAWLSRWITQVHSSAYRNPAMLPPGNVLVVGASASGVQIAHELAAAGRKVTLAVGRYTSAPRQLFGRDIYWWLDRLGILDERVDALEDFARAYRQPSLQLAGRTDGLNLDVATLQASGIRLVGRLAAMDDRRVYFAETLADCVRHAEAKRARLVSRVAAFAHATGEKASELPLERPLVLAPAPHQLDLHEAGVSTVVWATGFSRRYDWIDLPVTDAAGDLLHVEGALPVGGLYALGLRLMRSRRSHFIDGVGTDAAFIAGRIAQDFGVRRNAA
jgi:putative flavoprotein involved in K+ transport